MFLFCDLLTGHHDWDARRVRHQLYGGDAIDHSSVLPSHGFAPAGSPLFSILKMFQMKISIEAPLIALTKAQIIEHAGTQIAADAADLLNGSGEIFDSLVKRISRAFIT